MQSYWDGKMRVACIQLIPYLEGAHAININSLDESLDFKKEKEGEKPFYLIE